MKSKKYNIPYNFITFLTIFLITNLSSSIGQNKYDLKQFGDETVEFIKQPGNWTADDFIRLGIITGVTAGIMFVDEPVQEMMLKDQSYFHSIPIEFGRWWGEPLFGTAFGGLFLLHGIALDNPANKKLGFEILQSGIYTSAVIGILKFSFGRARPYTNEGAFRYFPFNFSGNQFWSLPSGHTALAFSLSTILSKNFNSHFLKAIIYIPAVMTAFSRVYQNRHWTSDVFLGGTIGYFIADFVYQMHKKNEQMPFEHSPIININLTF